MLTGVAFTQRGVVLGDLIVEENQKERSRGTKRMHRVFIFQSVRSRSSFPERIEKGNIMFVFFEQLKVLKKHRLLAVKYYTRIFLPSH